MAKDSKRRRDGFDVGETGGAFSGFLADEDAFDRRTYWRLGSWAAVALGAVAVAFFTSQSSIGWRREQTASAELIRQSQQIQLAARESLGEARRLSSAIDTLNGDRDRLYSRVAVLEQGLDSVTGSIARQASTTSKVSSAPANPNQPSASAASTTGPIAPASSPASPAAPVTAPAVASGPSATQADPASAPSTPKSAPIIAPVAATAPVAVEKAAAEKQEKQVVRLPVTSESSSSSVVALSSQQAVPASASVQPSGTLMASNSMMGPPDKTASKLLEPASPPKTFSAAPALSPPLQDIDVADASASETPEPDPLPAPALVVRRTEFGVDIGSANSMQGLRALWRGLLKSRTNVALTTLRPMIVIKENNSGMGMQLRLVAGPISDAAAAARICASLTVSERSCTTTVFEGQRLVLGDEKTDKPASEARATAEAKPDADTKPVSQPRTSGRRHYAPRHSARQEEPPPPSPAAAPKQEQSTLSAIFGSR